MEARNFISAREMLENGNWLIPTLNGDIRIRKPPLPTWLTAASIATVSDPNDLTALRFPAAVVATVMIFFLYGFVKDLLTSKAIAFYSAAVLATSYMFIEESRTGAWDIYCNAFMLGGIWMFYRGYRTNSTKYWILTGIFMGCSFMSKGPVSFYAMLIPFLGAFFLVKNGIRAPSTAGMLLCMLIAFVVSAIWPLYLYMKIPDIAATIVDEETSAWINRHNRPVWFYLHFPVFMGIWAMLVVATLANIKKLTLYKNEIKPVFFWFLITLILLSVVPEKKERYFLPALPPLSILTGAMIVYNLNALKSYLFKKIDLFTVMLQGVITAVAGLGIPVFLYFFALKPGVLGWPYFILLCLMFLILSFALIFILHKKRFKYVYPVTILMMILFCATSWGFLPNIEHENPEYRDLREVRNIKAIADKPLYTLNELNPIRIWEIGRKVMLIGVPKEDQDAVIITTKPMKGANTVHEFRYNRERSEDVLYFNVM